MKKLKELLGLINKLILIYGKEQLCGIISALKIKRIDYIVGPVSCYYLKIKYEGVDKRLLLFGDTHQSYKNNCKFINKAEIQYYLFKLFHDKKNMTDLFLESYMRTSKEEKNVKISFKYTAYMNDINNLFKECLSFNKNIRIKNLRCHYSDIRHSESKLQIKNFDNNIFGNLQHFYNVIFLKKYQGSIVNISEFSKSLQNILTMKDLLAEIEKSIFNNYYVKKELSKVSIELKNKIIKFVLKRMIQTDQFEYIKEVLKLIRIISSIKTEDEILKEKFNEDRLEYFFLKLKGFIVDCYVLARLAKPYIKDAVFYFGNDHIINYVDFLIENEGELYFSTTQLDRNETHSISFMKDANLRCIKIKDVKLF